MSDIQQIIELTERISKDSEALVGKIIELSYEAKGTGVAFLLFALGISMMGGFLGYVFARCFSKPILGNKKFVSLALSSLVAVGLMFEIAFVKKIGILSIGCIVICFGLAMFFFGNFFAKFFASPRL